MANKFLLHHLTTQLDKGNLNNNNNNNWNKNNAKIKPVINNNENYIYSGCCFGDLFNETFIN